MAIRGLLAQDFNLLFSVAKHRSLGLGYDSALAKHVEVAAFFVGTRPGRRPPAH